MKGRSNTPVVGLREPLQRRLVVAFAFMSVIPLLLIAYGVISYVFPHIDPDTEVVLRNFMTLMIVSSVIGYFAAWRIVRAVVRMASKARAALEGRWRQTLHDIDLDDPTELGELARAFNRITQELEAKIDELESSRQLIKRLLSRLGTAIVSYEGIDSLLELIVENTSAALEAQMGSLLLVDGEKQELEVKTSWSANGQRPSAQRMKLGEGIAGWVAKEGRPMRGTGSHAAVGLSDGHGREGAVLCVPLVTRENTIGVISVLREDAKSQFTEDDQLLLANISSQIAVAIENYRLNLDIERTYVETIMALALAVEAKDPYSAGHSKRVGFYSRQIGELLELDEETLRMLNDAGVLHDIGKIGIKDEILLKPNPLTPDEEKIMQQHAVIGEAIVKPVRSLQRVVSLVRHHHERYDGTGYPSGLKGEEIPLGARILAVADTYDSMVTDRPYRKRLPVDQAKAELKKCAGLQYDPRVVEAFLTILANKEQRHTSPAADHQPA